jgi:hypothetical protein
VGVIHVSEHIAQQKSSLKFNGEGFRERIKGKIILNLPANNRSNGPFLA